jgi:alpha-tubulin suppressor-like RCC1 family protein
MSDVFDVRVGFQDTVILKTNGTLYGAGAGSFGKFGTGTPSNYSTPIVIMTDVAVFSMPSNYTMIIKKNGSVYGMGSNSSGQLGNGTTQQALVPVKMY